MRDEKTVRCLASGIGVLITVLRIDLERLLSNDCGPLLLPLGHWDVRSRFRCRIPQLIQILSHSSGLLSQRIAFARASTQDIVTHRRWAVNCRSLCRPGAWFGVSLVLTGSDNGFWVYGFHGCVERSG